MWSRYGETGQYIRRQETSSKTSELQRKLRYLIKPVEIEGIERKSQTTCSSIPLDAAAQSSYTEVCLSIGNTDIGRLCYSQTNQDFTLLNVYLFIFRL